MQLLHLTPDMAEAIYELLRMTPPFKRWNLPHADEVEFRLLRVTDRYAGFRGAIGADAHNEIQVSVLLVRTLPDLLPKMAHEMVHFRQHLLGEPYAACVNHGPSFKRLAKQVCRYHGFDEATF